MGNSGSEGGQPYVESSLLHLLLPSPRENDLISLIPSFLSYKMELKTGL